MIPFPYKPPLDEEPDEIIWEDDEEDEVEKI